MKTTKRFSALLIIATIITLNMPNLAKASMPAIYPIWGYNSQNHICQIKQESAETSIRKNLTGDYWSLRECRSENPEIILYTGAGILIWFGILILAALFHYWILAKIEKRSKTEKTLSFLQDIVLMAIALFFIVLIIHYFDIPRAAHGYNSDIDHIIYSIFIRSQVPITIAGIYLTLNLMRAALGYRKSKK